MEVKIFLYNIAIEVLLIRSENIQTDNIYRRGI